MAKQIKNVMRCRAAQNAKLRAVAFSSALNQKTGAAIHITDNDASLPSVYGSKSMLNEVVVVGYAGKNKGAELANISFEKIKITADISVKFILLPEKQ